MSLVPKSPQNGLNYTKSHNDKHDLLFLKWNRGHRKIHFSGVFHKILLLLLCQISPIIAGTFSVSPNLQLLSIVLLSHAPYGAMEY